jgi:hypothetical protein
MTQAIDDDECTNSMGLFKADDFRLAATALGSVDVKHGHTEMPRRYRYYQVCE